jgi:two-component system cell cycle sensor histidine kinase PleC
MSRNITLGDAEEWTAGKLAMDAPTLSPTVTCGEAFDWFTSQPDIPAAAVVDETGTVHGLVNRLRFLSRYARRYHPELYSDRSVLHLGNSAPLVVDERTKIIDLSAQMVIDRPDALAECFVVTRGGFYLGLGTGEALMRGKLALLQAREAELTRALSAETQANQAKSSFLSLMSHELRTPLNAIIGFSEVLSTEIFGPLGSERYRSYAGDIHGAGRHLLALINDILDLSKMEAGKLDVHAEPVAVAGLIADCLKFVADRAAHQRIALRARCADDLPFLSVDALRTKQMLLNLLSNAVKFTGAGGRIEVGAVVAASGEMVLSVTDNGVGMAAEMIPLALEPFRQVDSSLARKFEGTGLGLPLVKSLVEQHGGRLELESALHKGTTARLVFPRERVVVLPLRAAG